MILNESKVLTEYDNLIAHAVRKYTKRIDPTKSCNTLEDYLQEGRLAALKAVRTYSIHKKTNIKSHIYNCVKNRMLDLHRKTFALRCPPIDMKEDMADYESGSSIDVQKLETRMTLNAYLETDEFKMIEEIFEGATNVGDIVDDLYEERSDNVKDKYERRVIREKSREDIVECLCRVQRLLRLKGVSQRSKGSKKH